MPNNQKPTEILKKDHKIIKNIIKILEACAYSLEEGNGKCDVEILNGSMNLIKYFTHKYHRRMEESALFKVAEKKSAPWIGGSVSSLLREHEEGAEQVRHMADILRESVVRGDFNKNNKKAKKIVIKNIYAYSALLGSHLIQEEKILYPIIESLLTNQEKKNLSESFERLRQEIKEIGDNDRYTNIIKKYKKRLEI